MLVKTILTSQIQLFTKNIAKTQECIYTFTPFLILSVLKQHNYRYRNMLNICLALTGAQSSPVATNRKSARFSASERSPCTSIRRVLISVCSSSFIAANSALLLWPRFFFPLDFAVFLRQDFSRPLPLLLCCKDDSA